MSADRLSPGFVASLRKMIHDGLKALAHSGRRTTLEACWTKIHTSLGNCSSSLWSC